MKTKPLRQTGGCLCRRMGGIGFGARACRRDNRNLGFDVSAKIFCNR